MRETMAKVAFLTMRAREGIYIVILHLHVVVYHGWRRIVPKKNLRHPSHQHHDLIGLSSALTVKPPLTPSRKDGMKSTSSAHNHINGVRSSLTQIEAS